MVGSGIRPPPILQLAVLFTRLEWIKLLLAAVVLRALAQLNTG